MGAQQLPTRMAELENPVDYVTDKDDITKERVRNIFKDAVEGTAYDDVEIDAIQLRSFPDEADEDVPFDVILENKRPMPAFVVTKDVNGDVWWGILLGVEELPELVDN